MSYLRRAAQRPELMDAPDVDPGHLAKALDHITAVNGWLGAGRALRKHLAWGLPEPGTARVLDVGAGSGDLATLMVRWGRAHARALRVTALDVHAATVALARERTLAVPEVAVVRGDGLTLPFPDATFDLVHLSMVLHHMDGPSLTGLLQEASRVARGGRILVGELERSVPNYLGARLMALTFWRGNPLTRHDGPLSVLRSFTPGELLELARAAGLKEPSVHRHPFYRLVLQAEAR